MKTLKKTPHSSILTPRRTSFRPIFFIVSAVITLFLLSATLTALNGKYRLAPSSIKEWTSSVSSETLLHFIGFENPYFTQVLPEDSHIPPVSSFALELVTSIKPGDVRSLLGNELPGFEIFDSEIIVAGEGTNYTNLPIESAPPVEVMMEEREVATEKLKELEEDKKEQNEKPPAETTHGKKVVYLYSTHSTESFLPILKGVDGYENRDEAFSSKINVIDIAQKLGEDLKKQGIGTIINDTNFQSILKKKNMKYWQSYSVSGNAVKAAINNQADLQLFFDIHRDTQPKEKTTKKIHGKSYARVAFVIGNGNPDHEKNEKMANILHSELEKKYPGLSRGLIGKNKNGGRNNGVYNQDLSDHSMLIEIGGVENTMEELYRTANALAEVISDYYWQQQDAKKVNG